MNRKIGIYIHVPFCISKCAYCDFYSIGFSEEKAEEYVNKVISQIGRWGAELKCSADTLYFGGGTPSLLKSEQIGRIIAKVKECFYLENGEITVEVNPKENLEKWFKEVKEYGVNRVSLGLQSGVDSELKILSRRHLKSDVVRTAEAVKSAGIDNFSLDIMLGIPNQTVIGLKETLEFAVSLNPTHISAYLLSVEEGAPLFKNREKYNIPNDETAGEFYLETCRFLKNKGFERYEISNFARDGKISKHNTKYWEGKEYLGIGPAAHSMLDNKHFYYERSLEKYLADAEEIYDSDAGGFEEKVMLALRLSRGISFDEIALNYSNINVKRAKNKADLFVKAGLLETENNRYFLSDKGALLSNSVITELILEFEKN